MKTIYSVKTSRILLKEPVQLPHDEVITSPRVAWEILRQLLAKEDLMQEHGFIVLLNSTNKVTTWKRLFTGGIDSVTFDPRIIFRYALCNGATSFILAHNHPSGNLEPSREDISVTAAIEKGCTFTGLRLLDHLVFDTKAFTSMRERHLF